MNNRRLGKQNAKKAALDLGAVFVYNKSRKGRVAQLAPPIVFYENIHLPFKKQKRPFLLYGHFEKSR